MSEPVILGKIMPEVLTDIEIRIAQCPKAQKTSINYNSRVLISGYLLFSLTSFGFAFSNSLIEFVVLFALYGIVYAIVDGNQRAYVSDLSSEELRATALGTFHTTTGLAALPASLIAGLLWQINPSITFIYGTVVSIISVVLFVILRKLKS
ncbi:MAG: MFS transporter [Sedimentisphaerales bacterium]|nr:MFS transporter [Sedimentisphaerales bacterium]